MATVPVIPEDQWLNAQRDFIECKYELKPLSLKYGVKYGTLRARAIKGQWGKQRAEYRNKVINAPPAQVAEVLAFAERPIVNGHAVELFSEGNQTYLAEIPRLTRLIAAAGEKAERAVDFVEAQAWTGIYDKLSERKRILMGIPLPAPIRQREKSAKGQHVLPVAPSPAAGPPADPIEPG